MEACGQVDRALDSRLKGLIFNSQCWQCIEASGKLYIPPNLGPPSRNGYLVHRSKVGSIVAGCWRPLPGEVKSEEHVWSHGYLDSKQIPLPINLAVMGIEQLQIGLSLTMRTVKMPYFVVGLVVPSRMIK